MHRAVWSRECSIARTERLRFVKLNCKQCIPVPDRLGGREPKIVQRDGAAPVAPTQNLKIPHGQLLIFTEQLANLLQAGMTLDEGLSVLEKRLKQPRLHQVTHALHQALIDGRSFSQALREFPRAFTPLYVNLVAAGKLAARSRRFYFGWSNT